MAVGCVVEWVFKSVRLEPTMPPSSGAPAQSLSGTLPNDDNQGKLSDGDVLHGFRLPVLLDAAAVAGGDAGMTALDAAAATMQWARRRLEDAETLWRQQQFHIRLVALFDIFPDLESFTLHLGRAPGSMRAARMSDFLDWTLREGSKSGTRVKAAVAEIKRSAGGASDEVMYDIVRVLGARQNHTGQVILTRANRGGWLEKALDERLVRVAKAALQADRILDHADDGTTTRPARRPRA